MRRDHQFTFQLYQGTLEEICCLSNLREAFRAVKRNKGSPGIDRVTIEQYESNLEEELNKLHKEVLSWTYKPSPVRRVEIPKPGRGKEVRKLGIPTVKDRVLQAAIKNVLEPIIDPHFSPKSYGFRPGLGAQQAIQAAQQIVQSGKE